MKAAQEGLDITGADFERVVSHLSATLADLGVAAPTVEAIGGKLLPLRKEIVTA